MSAEDIYMAWIEKHTEERQDSTGAWKSWIVLNEETEFGPYDTDSRAFDDKAWDLADRYAIDAML